LAELCQIHAWQWHPLRPQQCKRAALQSSPPSSTAAAHLAAHVNSKLLSHPLAASEQRAAGLRAQQQLIHDAAVAVDEVSVCARHAAVVQQPQQLLHHNAHLQWKQQQQQRQKLVNITA
jgi:hypothetical protein